MCSQRVASEGAAYQSNITGQNHHINSGSGQQNHISGTGHIINFDQSHYDKFKSDILQALYTSTYLSRKNRNPDRVPGTCEWFINHDQFKTWRERMSSSMLWVSANPGCGKSVLAKYLVDELTTTASRTTCYFFFKDDFDDQKSAKSALSCILHQLFTQREDLFSSKIIQRLKAYKVPLSNSYYELWELWDILIMAAQQENAGQIICILDAFDECEDLERQDLANSLCKFYGSDDNTKNHVNLKFLITSRPFDKIRRGFLPLNIPGLPVIHLRGESGTEIFKISQEIDVYIVDKVSRIKKGLSLEHDDAELLLNQLRSVPNQTYLWVYLTLNSIQEDLSTNKGKIREVISSLPPTVYGAYEKILLKSSNIEDARRLLHIIVAAERPLNLEEMNLALAVRPDHKSYKHLEDRLVRSFDRYVRKLCGLFVTIIDSKIYLLHQTAKEFLVPKGDHNPPQDYDNPVKWEHSLQPSESHRILFQICVSHLLFNDFSSNPVEENLGEVSNYSDRFVFLSYSALNWAAHFRASDVKDEATMTILRQLCDANSSCCMTWFRIYWVRAHSVFPKGFSSLMIAAYFGLEEIVKLLLDESNVKRDATDSIDRRSSLSWASEQGFDGVVKLLIKRPNIWRKLLQLTVPRRAKVDLRDRYGRTPLAYAAWNGHIAIVSRLVNAGARVDSEDDIGGSPLSYALCSEHRDVANILMKGAQPDSADTIRTNLLRSAVKNGYEPIVQRLLEDGASIEATNQVGQTPLLYVAEVGHEAIAKLLLDRGANIEAKDDEGRTPLLCAAEVGHEAIAKLLFDRGANIEAIDDWGQTPLLYAADRGHEAIAKLLFDKAPDILNTATSC